MSETALKFGPEWLRVLSHGGNVNSPPPSPGLKFKMAEHRYGREEMLALFNKHQSPPDGIQTLGSLYVEEPQEPLAFLPMNEEEQRMWQRGVNSDAVLRQSGRAPVNGVGRGRGGSVDRGRGRGRGAGSYYTRGLSYDEEVEPRGPREGGPPGMSLRSKPFERSQSVHEQRPWSDRGAGVTGPGGPEDRNGAISPRKEQGRASTENWRSRGGENEDNERWRGAGASRNEKWGTRGGWRERENGPESDWDEGMGRGTGRGVPVSSRMSRPPWDEKDGRLRKSWDEDNLPEWATENADEKGGSFDASGAFHGPGWSDEDDPNAEGRVSAGRARQKVSPDKTSRVEVHPGIKYEQAPTENNIDSRENAKNGVEDMRQRQKTPVSEIDKNHDSHKPPNIVESKPSTKSGSKRLEEALMSHEHPQQQLPPSLQQQLHPPQPQHPPQPHHHQPQQAPPLPNGIVSDEEEGKDVQIPLPEFQVVPNPVQPPSQPNIQMEPGTFPPREYQAEEEKLEHMRSVADDLVAKLVEEDDLRLQSSSSQVGVPPGAMGSIADPSSHPNSHTPPSDDKWFYMDPQGEVQGPFTASDMAEWHRAGYFTPNLLLRRDCDEQFAQLGELTRIFGRVPFHPGPPILPMKVTEVLTVQKAERERMEVLQNYMLQKQVYQHQMAVSRQQVLQKLQSLEEWSSLNPMQQQQLFMQQMMTVMPPHPTVPNVPPSTAPVTAIPSTTPVSAPAPDPRVVAGPDMRVLPGPVPPSSKPQDPIQALVAQMQTSSAASTSPSPSTTEGMLSSQLTATSMAAENPLQKLIMQLQRGQQPAMGSQPGSLGGSVTVSGAPATAGPLDNSPPDQQFDAIQSLMQQLTKMQPSAPDQMQEEHQRRQEEEQKRLEERRRLEEQQRAEEERIRLEELRIKEELKRQEEQRRNLEALRRQHEIETQRIEEEKRKMREEQARRVEEIRRIEEEKQKKEEEQKRKLLEQQRVETKRRQEELRRQQQQQKQQEESKRKEEARRQEEVRRQQEEERKKKEEEERRRREEEEEAARHQAQIQEDLRIAFEEDRKHVLMLEEAARQQHKEEDEERHQYLLQEHLKNIMPAWNNTPPVQAPEEKPAPSLIDIQRAQEEKEKKEREVEQQLQHQRQREAQRQAVEETRQKNSGLKWAAMAQVNPAPVQPVKSLLEIQAEEEKELKKRQEKEAAERAAAVSHMTIGTAGVWGSAVSNLSWASRASSAKSPGTVSTSSSSQSTSQQQWGGGASNGSPGGLWNNNSNSQPSAAAATSPSVWNNDHTTIWNQAENNSTPAGGFWDNPEPVKNAKLAPASGRTPTKPTKDGNKGGSGNQSTSNNNKGSKKKHKDENDAVKKLFTDNMTPADDFTRWCKGALNTLKVHASIDIPTFVTFLAEVESPYEVHDYIRSYLGDSKEVKEFAKQYLERRSKARNAHKERAVEDDILAPAPAINPTSSEFQEVKQTRNKKANKKKMQKVDSSILGFNVSSNERINIGERDYAE